MARRLFHLFCYALLLPFAVTACKQKSADPPPAKPPAPVTKAAPSTPLVEKREDLGESAGWSPTLDAYIERSLPPDLLSAKAARAVRSYCPDFAAEPDLDKRAFWAYTFQALAAAEAGLNPTANVHHTERVLALTDKVTRRPIRQEGLLQLTYEDNQRYGCDFDWTADRRLPLKDSHRTILEPERNLACGLKIMDDQIITQGKPLISRTSYWATLQPGTASYRVFAKQMANVPAACGLHRRRAVRRSRARRRP